MKPAERGRYEIVKSINTADVLISVLF